MVQNKQYFLSIVIVIIYSFYTYGPVQPLWNNSPYVPHQNVKLSCTDWLIYHDIVEHDTDNGTTNRLRAAKREKLFDLQVHVWAACYAYFISSFSIKSLYSHNSSLEFFCKRLNPHNVEMAYLALQDAKMTCIDWIYSYGYDKINIKLNIYMAVYRMKSDDKVPHILVTMYSRYIEKVVGVVKTPSEFCLLMENTEIRESRMIPFANLDTKKTCAKWIELSGYSDNYEHNIRKAFRQDMDLVKYQSIWTILYIRQLQSFVLGPYKPEAFCILIGYPTGVNVYYDKA